MTLFDRILCVDWSARSKPSPKKPSPDAIWIGCYTAPKQTEARYFRTRREAKTYLISEIEQAKEAGKRLLIAADFHFGFPVGFGKALTGSDSYLALWKWLFEHIEDGADNQNNRFDLAAQINARFPGLGPFWGHPKPGGIEGLPQKDLRHGHGLAEKRLAEAMVKRAKPVWQLMGNGSVGSQGLLGIPVMWALRQIENVRVWPFEPWDEAQIILAETYLSFTPKALKAAGPGIKDAHQVRLLAQALGTLDAQSQLRLLFETPDSPRIQIEGWTLGIGYEDMLEKVLDS